MAPESQVVLPHGLRLVVSTLREEEQVFRCSVFEVNVREEEMLAYRVISMGLTPSHVQKPKSVRRTMPCACNGLLPIK